MALNIYQRNKLEVQLRHLERTLREARQLLSRVPEAGRLTRYQPVNEAARPELQALVDQMLVEVEWLAERFDLPPQVESVGIHISAEMFAAWSDLQGLLSQKLKRGGEVDPAVGPDLDPHVQRLMTLAHVLANKARG
jgi:hypothetical protein